MVSDLMYSFQRHSDYRIVYYNRFTNKTPDYLSTIEYDAVIFHQSVTFCAEPQRGRRRIQDFQSFLNKSKAVRAALFQDEYICTDISVEFLNELKIDYAFTVMPQSEWNLVYGKVRKECRIVPMLTGYIEDKGDRYYRAGMTKKRTIDVGYRAVWNKQLIVLGQFGYDKIRIADCLKKQLKGTDYKTDIKVGWEYILKGDKWNEFLSSCRFVLGVESGGSVLDRDGSIYKSVKKKIESDPNVSAKELYKELIEKHDNSYKLRAISPRHFEAIEEGVCQILYEGNYSGVLTPGIHYIELKKDHSNLKEVIDMIGNETVRRRIVNNAYKDIIKSGKYTYKNFVNSFFNIIFENGITKKNNNRLKEFMGISRAPLHEKKVVIYIRIIQSLKKFKFINKIRHTAFLKMLMRGYYSKRL